MSFQHFNLETILFLSFTEVVLPTAKNTVISPNFLMWKFCLKAQFPHSARNYAEIVPFHNISTLGEIRIFYAVTV